MLYFQLPFPVGSLVHELLKISRWTYYDHPNQRQIYDTRARSGTHFQPIYIYRTEHRGNEHQRSAADTRMLIGWGVMVLDERTSATAHCCWY
jgi:ABC-type microcin C transport system duplicated ATPase subunit YejF